MNTNELMEGNYIKTLLRQLSCLVIYTDLFQFMKLESPVLWPE